MKDDYLAIRLPAALARALARLARARGVSRSAVVREAIVTLVEPAARPPASPPARPPARLTARELAAAWPTLPQLSPDEAEAFFRDLERGRESLVLPDERWE